MIGKLVYARTCWAALSLGRECTKKGNGCFIGYNIPFKFWRDDRWTGNPSKDNTARLFLEPSNILVKSLIKSNTAEEAAGKFDEATKKNILSLLKNKREPGAMTLVMTLWENMQGQAVLGNCEMVYDSS